MLSATVNLHTTCDLLETPQIGECSRWLGQTGTAGNNNGCSPSIYCTVCQILPWFYEWKSFYYRVIRWNALISEWLNGDLMEKASGIWRPVEALSDWRTLKVPVDSPLFRVRVNSFFFVAQASSYWLQLSHFVLIHRQHSSSCQLFYISGWRSVSF